MPSTAIRSDRAARETAFAVPKCWSSARLRDGPIDVFHVAFEPASDLPVDGLGADDRLIDQPVGRMKDERLGLCATQTAV